MSSLAPPPTQAINQLNNALSTLLEMPFGERPDSWGEAVSTTRDLIKLLLDAKPEAVEFFFLHASIGHLAGPTTEKARWERAWALAEAEQVFEGRGWQVTWHEDSDPAGDPDIECVEAVLVGDTDTETGPQRVSVNTAYDDTYRRVVTAELAHQSLLETT